MYNTIEELLERQRRTGTPLHRIILQNEMNLAGISEKEVYTRLKKRYEVMVASAKKALFQPQNMWYTLQRVGRLDIIRGRRHKSLY